MTFHTPITTRISSLLSWDEGDIKKPSTPQPILSEVSVGVLPQNSICDSMEQDLISDWLSSDVKNNALYETATVIYERDCQEALKKVYTEIKRCIDEPRSKTC